MTTYNTGNPIGSTDSRDRLDNTENMDYLENSTTELTHADRLGTVRKTRHGMEVEHDAQIAAHETEHDAQITAHEVEHDNQMQSFENEFDSRLAGMAFTRVGTFTTGATLTDMRQTLLWEVSQGGDGHEYGWTGSFLPSGKVVAAGSTPATSGGVGAGSWVDRTDDSLRDEIRETVFQTTKRSYAEAGFNLVDGSFEAGGTLVNANDVLLQERTGKAFSGPAGTVAAGTVPSGPNYTNRGDGTLRSALAAPDSTVPVGGVEARALRTVDGIKNLLPVANVTQTVTGFYSGANYGAGGFRFNPDRNQADHNGGTVISKTALDLWDGTFADLPTLLYWSGVGSGCFERVLLAGPSLPHVTPEMFGAVPDDISKPSHIAINKAFTLKSECKLGARYYVSETVRIGAGKCSRVTGIGMYQCGFTCINPDINVFELENDGYGLSAENFFVNHTSLGTGDGIVATTGNRSFTYRNILAETNRRGFSFDGMVYVFDIYSCRATNCVTGYYTNNQAGNSTSFSFYSCYATNVQIGFDIGQTKSLVMVQPIMDINRAGCNRMIRLRTVAVANISNIHLEGVPDVTGVCVEVTGSNTRSVNIIGFHCDTRCPVGAEWLVLSYNFAGSSVVSIDGLDGSRATNTNLYAAYNSSGDNSRLVFGDNNFMGGINQGLTGRVRSGIAGTLSVKNPAFTGTINATSGDTITTGLPFAPNQVILSVNKPSTGEALVVANPYEFGGGGTFRVRFVRMSDQTADFGTHSLTWRAEMTFR